MKRMHKILSLFLSLCLIVGMLPVTALATSGEIGGVDDSGNRPGDPSPSDIITAFKPLEDDVKNQTVPFGTEVDALKLPGRLGVEFEGANPSSGVYGVKWAYDDYDAETPGDYLFTAVCDTEKFTFADGIVFPTITVTVKEPVPPAEYTVGTWDELVRAVNDKGNSVKTIIVTQDLSADSTVTIPNGYDVTLKADNASETVPVIEVKTGDTSLFKVDGSLQVNDLVLQGQGTENYTTTLISVTGSLNMTNVIIKDHGAKYEGSYCSYSGQKIRGSNNCVITLTNCKILNNVSGIGGTIQCKGGTLRLEECVVANNVVESSSGNGGAISASDSEVTILDSKIENNGIHSEYKRTVYGGALYLDGGKAQIINTRIEENIATAGAGIFSDGTDLTIRDSFISNNHGTSPDLDNLTSFQGGGIYQKNGSLEVSNTDVIGNSTEFIGGGMYINGTNVTLDETINISGNSAVCGGGIYTDDSKHTITLDGASVKNNTAVKKDAYSQYPANNGCGGGIANDGGNVVIRDAVISGNEADVQGGGIANMGTLNLLSGTITENQATGTDAAKTEGIGGGIANRGTFTMTGGKLCGNTAERGGSDFYNYAEGNGNIEIDPDWDGDHDMELDSLSLLNRAVPEHGTFTLLPARDFGFEGWYEDTPGKRYDADNTDSNVAYTVVNGDTAEKYLTLGEPLTYTVTFDKNEGDTEATPKQVTVTSGSTVGTLPTPPTRAGYTFQGWNTVADGSGTAFTATTPVTSNITVYAQWEQLKEQLWYYEVYYQFYTSDGDHSDENGAAYNWVRQSYGQGGWAFPDDEVSINHEEFDGTELDWDAVDGSGPEILGTHYVFDTTYGPHRLSALCGEATADDPLKIYYRATPHTVTYQYTGEVPAGAPEVPAVVHTGYSAPVTVAANPTMDGYIFSGWTVKSPASVTIENGQLTMPNQNVVLTGSWKRTATPVDPEAAAYRVEHYQEQLDGSYRLSATEFPLYGEIGKTVTAAPKTYEHYHVNQEKSTLTGIVTMPAAGEDGVPEILTLQVYYDLDTVTVSYDLNGGTGKDGVSYDSETVKHGAAVAVKDAPRRSGYTFEGWSDGNKIYHPGDVLTVLGTITLTAQWDRNSSGGGGGGTTYYTLHYDSNGGTKYKDERYRKNTVVELDKAPTREGYTFTGWYADEELTDRIDEIKMTRDKTVYAGWEATGVPEWLNGDDHFAYVVGYGDGTVRPNNNITRAEVAMIFYRLLKDDVRAANETNVNTFTDVEEGMWCNTAISTIARLGIVKGRSAEIFDPDAPITRAEFAAVCARFDQSEVEDSFRFSDIQGHWAESFIERAASLGWISGYKDGTFRPEKYITRAEAMTMINRVLNRLPEDEDDLLPDMKRWPDNQPDAWYYLAVQEATNGHEFNRKSDGVHEYWTRLTTAPN